MKNSGYVYNGLYRMAKIEETYNVGDLTKVTPKCNIYGETHEGQNSCVKCDMGYFGIIQNWNVKYCHTYDASKCTKCIHGYYPSANGLECLKINI